MKRTAQINAERHFWQEMKQNWQASQSRAQCGIGATSIDYQPTDNSILFKWSEYRRVKKTYHERIKIPSTIKVISFKKLVMMPNGYVQAGTQKFYSSTYHKQYKMKVQFAWGGFYVADN
ncbi:hypothetical protein [Paucilactobacillus suebicus]|nr:hypothetical protein [Paucilactobacillus suebicus]